ncbi:MAG TPA: hypothetical protein VNJ08_03405 [Bacteriovoracaceae bacterium]|nr:hypothetical protein [Bacteriovoracaceae bacterium]
MMEISVNGNSDELFLSDTTSLAGKLLGEILSSIKATPAFTIENETLRNNYIAGLTVDISRFVEITTLLSKIIMLKSQSILSEVKDSHIHLLFVMKGISQAQQKQDLVALEDLIKYELKDNLTQWKIDLIPQIKRLLKK